MTSRARRAGGARRRKRSASSSSGRSSHRSRRRTSRARSCSGRTCLSHRGVQREPRVRDRVPGDDERRRGDARRAALGRDRRRRRQRERRAHHGLEASRAERSSRRTGAGPSPRSSARFAKLGPKDFLPVPPALKEPTTGPLDGGERREDGEGGGHPPRRAGRVRTPQPLPRGQGVGDGRFAGEVMHVVPAARSTTRRSAEDNVVRKDSHDRRLRDA